jgi:hypothetical protein
LLFLFDESKVNVLERSLQNKNGIFDDDYKWITNGGKRRAISNRRACKDAKMQREINELLSW